MNVFPGRCTDYWPATPVRASRHKAGVVFAIAKLLKKADNDFDLLITADQNILYQQNLAGSTISILELSTNDLRRIVAAAPLIQRAVEEIRPGQFVRLDIHA